MKVEILSFRFFYDSKSHEKVYIVFRAVRFLAKMILFVKYLERLFLFLCHITITLLEHSCCPTFLVMSKSLHEIQLKLLIRLNSEMHMNQEKYTKTKHKI